MYPICMCYCLEFVLYFVVCFKIKLIIILIIKKEEKNKQTPFQSRSRQTFPLPHCQVPKVYDFLASFSSSCCPFLLHACLPLAFSPQQLDTRKQFKSYMQRPNLSNLLFFNFQHQICKPSSSSSGGVEGRGLFMSPSSNS